MAVALVGYCSTVNVVVVAALVTVFHLLYWFKNYGNFDEWVDFSCWWSCIGKGLLFLQA